MSDFVIEEFCDWFFNLKFTETHNMNGLVIFVIEEFCDLVNLKSRNLTIAK